MNKNEKQDSNVCTHWVIIMAKAHSELRASTGKKKLNTKEDKCQVYLLKISVLSNFWARHVNCPEIPCIGRYIQASICISPLRFSTYDCSLQESRGQAVSRQLAGTFWGSLRLIFHLQISHSQLNFLCFDNALSICLALIVTTGEAQCYKYNEYNPFPLNLPCINNHRNEKKKVRIWTYLSLYLLIEQCFWILNIFQLLFFSSVARVTILS